MKILVTGGAGYIGSHTVIALFEAGHVPVILDDLRNSQKFILNNIEKILNHKPLFYQGDCADKNFLRTVFFENNIDGVIHFVGDKAVGESVSNPLKYYRNNIDSLLSVLEIMKEFKVINLIFSSSATVYGEADFLPITEEAPRKKATSPYGNTKQICEDIISDVVVSRSFSLKAVALRYFNPIGAHSSGLIGELPVGVPNNLVPYLTQAAAKKRGPLTVFGDDYPTFDGSGIRDFIHVSDLAEAHVSAFRYLEKKQEDFWYEVFNVGTGNGNSVFELIKEFEKENNVLVPYVIGPRRPGDIAVCYADVKKIKNIIGWSAKRQLFDSLRDAWRWENNYYKFK